MSKSIVIEAVYEQGLLRPLSPITLTEQAVVQLRVQEETATDHPHVTRIPGVSGGRPIIRGTRTPVQIIVGYYKLGMSIDEIVSSLPHLTPAQVFDALSYYHDHQAEIEADITAGEPENLLARYGLQREVNGRVRPIPENDG